MRVLYKGRTHRTNAYGEYDLQTGELTVEKGSIVSETVVEFKSASSVKKMREENVDKNGYLKKDLKFSTPSAAAAFVSGYSANGYLSWHVEKHLTLRDALKK